jgi:hypothetical protein
LRCAFYSRLSLVGGTAHRHIDAKRNADYAICVGGLLHDASDSQSKLDERAQGEPTIHQPSPPVWSAFLSYLSSPQPRFAGCMRGIEISRQCPGVRLLEGLSLALVTRHDVWCLRTLTSMSWPKAGVVIRSQSQRRCVPHAHSVCFSVCSRWWLD